MTAFPRPVREALGRRSRYANRRPTRRAGRAFPVDRAGPGTPAQASRRAGKGPQRPERPHPDDALTRTVAPRTIRVLPRGNWMDDSGEEVTPGVPGRPAAAAVEGRPAHPARPGPLDRRPREPAHRARARQSALEALLRRGPLSQARRPGRARANGPAIPNCSTGSPRSSSTPAGT